MFKGDRDLWETLLGNCDSVLYLGGNEHSTHEVISKMLGKATIDTRSYGHSKGRNGNYSTNKQIIGRELLLPNEVRELDNDYGILFIKGAKPVWDKKFRLEAHRKNHLTANGKGTPYIHRHRIKTKAFEDFDFENAEYYEVIE